MKRYYLEVTPQIRDGYGTPRNALGTTRYLIDSVALQLPEVFEQTYVVPYVQPVRGNGGDEFSVQFTVKITDADAPQPEAKATPIEAPVKVAKRESIDEINALQKRLMAALDKPAVTLGPTGEGKIVISKLLQNAFYGKDKAK